MDVTLLSGVVRNRKVTHTPLRRDPESSDGSEGSSGPVTGMARVWVYLSGSALLRNFNLRVHKFTFQWDLATHFSICIASLAPFSFSGNRLYAVFPICVWGFYNTLVLIGTRRANLLVPGFGRFKHTFKASVEEFFSPKLLPVLSFSFLLVALSLAVTGRRLGGPPLCYSSCGQCLSIWSESFKLPDGIVVPETKGGRAGCGYSNGKEMLGYYTMAQTSFLLFMSVIVAMAVCMAWRIADEELQERQAAEEWLKREDPFAFELREEIMRLYGNPASAIRPEGNPAWVFFGIVAALTFTLLGWHNWYVLPPSHTATLLIILNLLTILLTTLILHLSFFGRLLALYKRNLLRVQCLTRMLKTIQETQINAWWNCRNFVLNDDLALDYDIGGLAVSATFLINIMVFIVLLVQTYRDGFKAMMEPPGSYCGYACLYITMCLIKIFSLATETFQEQYRHVSGLQSMNAGLTSTHRNYSSGNMSLGSNSYDNNEGLSFLPNSSYLLNGRHEDVFESDSVEGSDAPDIDDMDVGSEDYKYQGDELMRKKNQNSSFLSNNSNNKNKTDFSHFGQSASPSSTAIDINTSNNLNSPEGNTFFANGDSDDNSRLNNLENSPNVGQKETLFSTFRTLAINAVNISSYTKNNNTSNISNIINNKPNIVNMGMGNQDSDGPYSGVSNLIPSLGLGSTMLAANTSVSIQMTPRDSLGDSMSTSAALSSSLLAPSSSSSAHTGMRKSHSRLSVNMGTGFAMNTSIPSGQANSHSHSNSISNEGRRQAVAEMISQIRKYDPYPCILGIPVMPALFATCKFYIFVCFLLIGTRTMVACMREI